jgi:hypothetical protein
VAALLPLPQGKADGSKADGSKGAEAKGAEGRQAERTGQAEATATAR